MTYLKRIYLVDRKISSNKISKLFDCMHKQTSKLLACIDLKLKTVYINIYA